MSGCGIMNPITVQNSLVEDVATKSAPNSVFVKGNGQSRCDVKVLTGQNSFEFQSNDKVSTRSVKSHDSLADSILDNIARSSEMIYKYKNCNGANSTCVSESREVSDMKRNDLSELTKNAYKSIATAKQNTKLTDIVKEITEKKRQTSSECFDANSKFRCHFSINGVPSNSSPIRDLETNTAVPKEFSSKEKLKINRRKQKPQKATSTEAEPILNDFKGYYFYHLA